MSVGFQQVTLGKHIIWTAHPDPFCGEDSPVPTGSICVTFTGHNLGSGIQHLKIPACFLTPANPTSKNQLCLVFKGPKVGTIVQIKECWKKTQNVVTDEGDFLFSDVCAALEYTCA